MSSNRPAATIRFSPLFPRVAVATLTLSPFDDCSAEQASPTTAPPPPSTTVPFDTSDTATRSTTEAPATTTATPSTTAAPTTVVVTADPPEIPDRSLLIPESEAPVIDGVIDAGEWAGAATVSMSNGVPLHWMRSGETSYVALEGDEIGAVNLMLATENELWILHSSAALGSMLLHAGQNGWQQMHGFDWCCRSANDDTARLALLESDGWQANIGYAGDRGVVEYQVELPWGFAMSAVACHIAVDAPSPYWSIDIAPVTADFIVNNRWTDPGFDVAEWWILVPGGRQRPLTVL